MRYILGIDLGTTNSCICFVDTQDPKRSIQLFRIPQIQRLGHVEALPTLPSFCFCAPSQLPWNKSLQYDVGTHAREEGAKTPTKLVESAKSWLCHAAANRRDRLLPVEAASEADRISPVEASARYLRHLKEAWNHGKAKNNQDALFEEQDIVLTVPASFDEAARALTIEAARLAGISQLTLLEEPQAAFYSWIAQHESSWKDLLKASDQILVCDVGGGTTDFSLIDVHAVGADLSLQRMAVGDHLLLGGDNMDIAIAHFVEQKLFGSHAQELAVTPWLQLRHQARKAKEALLDESSKESSYRFLLQGAGSSVVAQTLSAVVTREEIQKLLSDGFFPPLDWDSACLIKRGGGVKTMGLPYETEAAITKHLAAFLNMSGERPQAPDYILFNGGAMKPLAFQHAIRDSIQRWFPHKQLQTLPSYHLDLSVGRGAAYYGLVRRGLGVRIGGGSARGYYLGVEVQAGEASKEMKALTLLPRGSEEGALYEPEQLFMLRPNVPVSFTLYSSHVRLHDRAGDLIDIDPKEMHALPFIQTILRFGKTAISDQAIPVRVGIALSCIGTIELWLQAQASNHRWKLEFQLRTADGKEQTSGEARHDETFDASFLNPARDFLSQAFSGHVPMGRVMEKLEALLDQPRKEWAPSILRGLWETLWKLASQRKKSQEFEARWWNLAGFMLRPGFGHPLDDFRMKELWKIILSDFKATRLLETEMQRWICLRRVAAGLSRGQQSQVAAELWPQLLDKQTNKMILKGKGDAYPYTERLRTAASLELAETTQKIKLGNAILNRILKDEAISVDFWALGRLGARHLFHGAAGNVIPRETAIDWIEKLLARRSDHEGWAFAVGQIARKTDQRELNLPLALIQRILVECQDKEFYSRLKTLLTDAAPLTRSEQDKVFGEQLPAGLIMRL